MEILDLFQQWVLYTMGNIHHKRAKDENEVVIVSIFVNPTKIFKR